MVLSGASGGSGCQVGDGVGCCVSEVGIDGICDVFFHSKGRGRSRWRCCSSVLASSRARWIAFVWICWWMDRAFVG